MKMTGSNWGKRSRWTACKAATFFATLCLSKFLTAASLPEEVPNFALLDVQGRYHEFHRTGARVLVLFFTGNECPVARQCIQKLKRLRKEFGEEDVAIWAVDANTSDDRESILKEATQLKANLKFPFLRDDTQGLARLLGVSRTGTAVAISSKDGHILYHGAVDDQLSEGAAKPVVQHPYLQKALKEFLAGKLVSESTTPAHGCLINYEGKLKDAEISYVTEVAPILAQHCMPCHSPGNIGPFSMSNYEKIKSKSAMIQEVLLARRMPPWSADTEIGHYAGERTLTLDQTRTLLGWIALGAPRGEGEDPLPKETVPTAEQWPLGQPDYIVKLPVPEEIPSTGVLEYRHIKVPVPVEADTWLGAVAVHPGNRKVVHHCIVRVRSEHGHDDGSGRGAWLQGWAPGIRSERFPEGTGRLLPKGGMLDIELHYTTMGSPQTDQTEIGFYKLPSKPAMVLENVAAYNQDFSISPGEGDAQTFGIYSVKSDSLLFALSPHMHLRGSWMRYEALYPDGKRQTLLSVPHYDFNWQTSYRLPQPKRLPAGTWILCSGGFDNSPLNPNNPAPAKRVGWGDQSFDEMFIGFMEMAEIPEAKRLSQAESTGAQ
jgi:peroxiredoxin